MTQTVLRWKALTGAGLEHCVVETTADSVRIRSVIVGSEGGVDFGLSYAMELDSDWTFRTLSLERLDGAYVQLIADGKGNWMDGAGTPIGQLQDCIDIDISGTPLTNTLPLRRLRLRPNVPQSIYVAYVPLDTMLPRRDAQIYTRLDDGHVRFRAVDTGFEQVIGIDADDFVSDYPTLFARA